MIYKYALFKTYTFGNQRSDFVYVSLTKNFYSIYSTISFFKASTGTVETFVVSRAGFSKLDALSVE